MITLKVQGMTCGGCVKAVTRAVQAVPRVERVAVDLASGEVRVEGAADPLALRAAIEAAGFEPAAA